MRVALTIVFLATGALCARRAVAGDDRPGYAANALMAASMAAMVWFPPRWPAGQMAVFAVAGGYFAVRAAGVSAASLRPAPPGAVPGAPGGRVRHLHHAVVMAAMVWMLGTAAPMPGMAMPRDALPAAIGGGYCLASAALLLIAAARRGTGDLVHAVMTAGLGAMFFGM